MLYNIHCWWFFLSHYSQWRKYLVHPKIRRPKPCLLIFASLVALGGFHRLLFTQLTADLTPECSGGSMFHPVSHICAKKSFLLRWNSCKQCSESSVRCCFRSTVSKRGTYFERSFLNDKFSCKRVNTRPSDIFNFSAISRNFNLRSGKRSLWGLFFLMFSGTTSEFGWPECSASFVSVRLHLKSAYHLLTNVSDGAESE